MSEYSYERAMAEMRAAPQQVTSAGTTACLFGIVVATRILFLGSLPLRKSIFFAGVMGLNFAFNGMSLLSRKKSGYVLLVIFSALPLLGSFAYSVHLYSLILTGAWINDPHDALMTMFGTAQLCLIVYLYRNLFSLEVRQYVWKSASAEAAVSPEPVLAEP